MLYAHSLLPPIQSILFRLSFTWTHRPLSSYPHHGASSAITAPYSISGLWWICTSLYLAPQRRRMLYLMTKSNILDLTKLHIFEYSYFSLLLRSESKRFCATTASVPVIPYVKYTLGVKLHLRSIQGWRYFSFFSFSAVVRALADIWCK